MGSLGMWLTRRCSQEIRTVGGIDRGASRGFERLTNQKLNEGEESCLGPLSGGSLPLPRNQEKKILGEENRFVSTFSGWGGELFTHIAISGLVLACSPHNGFTWDEVTMEGICAHLV